MSFASRVFVTSIAVGSFLCASVARTEAPEGAAPRSAPGESGLPRRPAWTTSRVKGTPEPPLPYAVEPAFPKLKFTSPVTLTNAPGTERLFVVEVLGKVYSFRNDRNCDQADLMLDLVGTTPKTASAYGLAFHPDFERNRYLYLCCIGSGPNGSRITRFTASQTDPPTVDPSTAKAIFTWPAGGHNGCSLKFGPDGFLYISTGDGVGPNPPDTKGSGQDVSNVFSCVLRIDVDNAEEGREYAIPADNPFVELAGARPEIWAYGFRNPWKMSFDRKTGDLWVGDVGWEMWELIYRVERGGNYGWSIVEGRQPVHPNGKRGPTPILPPVMDHDHYQARSITGGFVYRGGRLEGLVGSYVYGDYSTGRIWALRYDGERVTELKELVDTSLQIVAFGEDNAGEIYIVDYQRTGLIYRLIPNPVPDRSADFPRTLSATGLFTSVKDHAPAPGVVPYSINAEIWSGQVHAERLLALPGDSRIEGGKGQLVLPNNVVLARTVSWESEPGNPASRRRLETQILHRDNEDWRPYAYVWNEAQTDATLADAAGAEIDLTAFASETSDANRARTWRVHSRAECSVCHTDKLASLLAFDAPQLNRMHDFGGIAQNQLRAWSNAGILSPPLTADAEKSRRMVARDDASASLEDRARSYLHVNCRHCHRPGGGGTSTIHLDSGLPLEQTRTVGAKPAQGTFDLANGQVITPGDPYASVLFYRLSKLGRGRMPHIGNADIDQHGLNLIHEWISGMKVDDDAQVDRPDASALLEKLDGGASIPAQEQTAAIRGLLSSTRGALMLARRLSKKQCDPAVHKEVVATANSHSNVNVRDLFERFVPPDQRRKRLGDRFNPEEVLALDGNEDNGRQAFFFGTASQCKNCHRAHGVGGTQGPDLSSVGTKYSPQQLLETILDPSKKIEEKYLAYLVSTKGGALHTGVIASKTADEIVLFDADARTIRIPNDEVEEIVAQKKSIMPDRMLRDMTAQEAADLLAYLVSLKAPLPTKEGSPTDPGSGTE